MHQVTGLLTLLYHGVNSAGKKGLKIAVYGRLYSKVITVCMQVPESHAIYILLLSVLMCDCPVDVG
jgi:hypothetical protein